MISEPEDLQEYVTVITESMKTEVTYQAILALKGKMPGQTPLQLSSFSQL